MSIQDHLLLLKSASLFRETPDDILVQVAELLEPVEYQAGESIFTKGDAGNCMYIIASGRVRVHDDDRILDVLEKSEVFGEMAALDPEPRSASVTALEATRLLRLRKEQVDGLIYRQPEISRGIIHILVRRLRSRTGDMAEDYRYMQQFARVIAAAAAVEAGVYTPESLDEVAAREDELGQLARVFQGMVRQVYQREQRLKRELAELRIEIDESKRASQVAEITETDYFQRLRKRARQLRAAREDGPG